MSASYDAILADLRAKAAAEKTAEQARWREAEADSELRLVVLRELLAEALDEWAYASGYKGEYLAEKHGDAERIGEMRGLLARLAGQVA